MRVVFAPVQKCVLSLRPGEVKRVMASGPLTGYTIACPGCGKNYIYLHDQHRFIEGEWTVTPYELRTEELGPGQEEGEGDVRTINVRHPTNLGAQNQIRCLRCHGMMTLRDGEITCASPG